MRKNILVADSGATKTDWILLNEGEKLCFKTKGLNPQIQQVEEMKDILADLKLLCGQIFLDDVHFYGAGCSREENCNRLQDALESVVQARHYYIRHDLLAAAHALFGNQPGIACILGTGSNSGVFDGNIISANIPALGYILGDEGSGAYLGKLLLRDYLYGKLDKQLQMKLAEEFELSASTLLNKVYREKGANVFLASLGGFISMNRQYPYCAGLLRQSFIAFFEHHIFPYSEIECMKVGFVGSIAFHNQEMLKEIAMENNIIVGDFISSPIETLLKYHLTQ